MLTIDHLEIYAHITVLITISNHLSIITFLGEHPRLISFFNENQVVSTKDHDMSMIIIVISGHSIYVMEKYVPKIMSQEQVSAKIEEQTRVLRGQNKVS